MIIVDRSTRLPRVLMGKRHPGASFMPGKFVFPGGGVEPADRRMRIAGVFAAPIESRLTENRRISPGLARALGLAAIRETFEETGILLGTREVGPPPDPPAGAWTAFATHGIFPTLEPLHLVARAITPPGQPRRFDAFFFAIDADEIAHRVEGVVGATTELVELVWVGLSDAVSLDLPAITANVLKDLETRLDAGMGHALPVPFYRMVRGSRRREEL